MKKLIFVFTGLIIYNLSWCQYINVKAESLLRQHVEFLADDKLEGRMTGSNGERLALEYISGQFKKAGIKPAGSEGYIQPFEFTESIVPTSNTRLVIAGSTLVLGTDFYPLSQSGNGSVVEDYFYAGYGIHAPKLGYDDYRGNGDRKGMIFIMSVSSPDGLHPHSKYVEYTSIDKKVATAIEQGATAVIFFNDDKNAEDPSPQISSKITPYDIPVVFCKKDLSLNELIGTGEIEISVELKRNMGTGHNVLGFIDNKAVHTVVIGAHYDHLGFGDAEHSLHRGALEIHNGADDNASGTSAMIEIGRYLTKSKWKNNNYLFIGFSGEELGLYGSAFFTKSDLFSNYSINYMINMDMVGRLNEQEPVIIVNGVGTSESWLEVLNDIQIGDSKVKTTESGIGPSDHTSFYFRDIPAVHFFSGTHSDYHKPSDDADKVNYAGMKLICNYILTLVGKLDSKGKLEFRKTKEAEQSRVAFKVTMGVVPDYTWEGEGMRIDGVSEGKPAALSGLKGGDIIIQIGNERIKDIYAYMGALGKLSKGDVVDVIFIRSGKEMTTTVNF